MNANRQVLSTNKLWTVLSVLSNTDDDFSKNKSTPDY